MAQKKPAQTLETSMKELEKLIEKMEKKDLPLEDSLNHFEKGVKLILGCQKILQDTEQRVKVLLEKHGQEALEDFDDD